MKINDTYEILRGDDGVFILYKDSIPWGNFDSEKLKALYTKMLLINMKDQSREDIFNEFLSNEENSIDESASGGKSLLRGIELLINFFSEFNFSPSFRFLNTMGFATDKRAYINNYFALMASPYADDVREKTKSKEFSQLIKHFDDVEPSHTINKRFRIYYGAQGTGKTTKALEETNNLCVVCNSSMLPADLMEDFTFDDGKAAFHPSALCECMEQGKPIVLDEINLLPFDSLRFLQGIFDGKTEFQYKGRTIHINDGFKVIGTMNLTVNGVSFGLPEPLVDRCESIEEFVLSPNMLLGAF